MNERQADAVLTEAAAHLAFLSTKALYDEQPDLWKLGEDGRRHTLDDFVLHFTAVASGVDAFRAHVDYSYTLFAQRDFPRRWLDDAWRVMERIGAANLDEPARGLFLGRLRLVIGGPTT